MKRKYNEITEKVFDYDDDYIIKEHIKLKLKAMRWNPIKDKPRNRSNILVTEFYPYYNFIGKYNKKKDSVEFSGGIKKDGVSVEEIPLTDFLMWKYPNKKDLYNHRPFWKIYKDFFNK